MLVRQSTARTIIVGPILDTDGAAKTDEVVASIKIHKNGGAAGALDGSATLTHSQTGFYRLALTANDLDTLGCAEITLNSGTNSMPPRSLNVVTADAWDTLHHATNGSVRADAVKISGSAAAADSVESNIGNLDATVSSRSSHGDPDPSGYIDAAISSRSSHGDPDPSGFLDAAVSSRAAASLFSGITSLAQWLGLIAGKQVGDATARTELRDTGAGAGTYDETTDSQEAIRDRGDTAWVTATGFATPGAQMDLVDAPNATAIAAIQNGLGTSTKQDTIIGEGDTGITLNKMKEMLAAFIAGKVSRSSAGGVTTLTYKKRDGTTTSFTAVCDEDDGDRATTGSLS